LLKKINIAIDGYSSCGKSTIAKALAAELGYRYVDSGAMYRAVTFFGLREGHINDDKFDKEAFISHLDNINLGFEFNPSTKSSEMLLNGENIEKEIRSMYVSDHVSKVSTIREIRQKMVAIQKKLGRDKGIVMDGRDIGTVVFPDAELKLFMTADIDVRVYRRFDELTSKGERVTFEEVKENLLKRDHDDTTRKDNPLVKAKDAIILDNTDISKQQQLDYVIKLVNDLQLIKEDSI
jgi:CMP/dCMP kinase